MSTIIYWLKLFFLFQKDKVVVLIFTLLYISLLKHVHSEFAYSLFKLCFLSHRRYPILHLGEYLYECLFILHKNNPRMLNIILNKSVMWVRSYITQMQFYEYILRYIYLPEIQNTNLTKR